MKYINELIYAMEDKYGHRVADQTGSLSYLADQLNRAAKSYASSGCRNTTAQRAMQEKSRLLLEKALFISFLVNWDTELPDQHLDPESALQIFVNDILSSYQKSSINASYFQGINYEGD